MQATARMLETAGILKNGEVTSTGYMKAVQEMAKYQDSQLSYRPTQRDIHQSIVQHSLIRARLSVLLQVAILEMVISMKSKVQWMLVSMLLRRKKSRH